MIGMEPFRKLGGIVAPLDRVNVDTDQIVPKQVLKLMGRTGFGQYLFYDWRYYADGNPRPDFVLNEPRYVAAKILLTRANFGCGSSREHAVWALLDYGFRVLIAPSFADILYNNCFKNGVLPIILNDATVDTLFEEVARHTRYSLDVDLERQTLSKPNHASIHFDIDPFRRKCLLEGLDDIGLTLKHDDRIQAYEKRLKPFQLACLQATNH
jgi:3-isopropylmalate/(R)-2-methylmalate dehydratase small subunit